MTFKSGGDLCLGFFQEIWDACHLSDRLPLQAHVLEIGCAEADWLGQMRQARPDLHLTGIDTRETDPRPAADLYILGDVLQQTFEPASFNAIVAVSVIEWIGLGFYQGNPTREGADVEMLRRCRDWIRPGGWLYLDTPYNERGTLLRRHLRAYDWPTLTEMFDATGWQMVKRQHFTGDGHPDGPYVAVLLEPR